MTTRPDEPHHRQWLHAMEDDRSVPGTAMQVGRILADYAVSLGGQSASVSWATLQRQTHRSRDAIDQAIRYLVNHGWLFPHPRKNGQRSVYDLSFGEPGSARRPVRLADRSAPPKQSGGQTAQPRGDQSGQRTVTSPASGPSPVRLADHERHTSETSLSPQPGSLHAALSAAVPDVTERETELALAEIKSRPGVMSAAAVLRAEIRDGGAPALIAQVRRNAALPVVEVLPECGKCDNRFIYDDQGRAVRCPDCHPAAQQPAREAQPA